MPIDRIISMYREEGYDVLGLINPYHHLEIVKEDSNYMRDLPFAFLGKSGEFVGTGGGISITEVYFFDLLSRHYDPKSIFIIGNAFGWSTLCLSLLFPKARIVAIDNLTEGGNAEEGFNLTRSIIEKHNLNCEVLVGSSPQDVKRVMRDHLGGGYDMAFIDGFHDQTQIMADFIAVSPFASDNALLVFHDVINWNMQDAFRVIAQNWDGEAKLMTRTMSGMGVLYRDLARSSVEPIIDVFCDQSVFQRSA